MDTVLVGNLTRDPELRFVASGQATASFGLAVNRVWTDRVSQERREQTSFFDVVCWGTLAENVAASLQKGDRAVVTGRLEQRTWETQEGERRSKVEVVADEVSPSLRWATAKVTKNDRAVPPAAVAPAPVAVAAAAPTPVVAAAPAVAPAPAAAAAIAEARAAVGVPAAAPAEPVEPVELWAGANEWGTDEEPF